MVEFHDCFAEMDQGRAGSTGRLLLVSATSLVQQRFAPLFTPLAEQKALYIIQKFLGRHVRETAVYVVDLLPQLRPGAGAQPGQGEGGTATAGDAAAGRASCAAATLHPVGVEPLADDTNRAAALLFAAMVLSDCGRGVPCLVRFLLQGVPAHDRNDPEGGGCDGGPLDRDVVLQFLAALADLCRMQGCLARQKQYMAPLRNAVLGEEQAYLLYHGRPQPQPNGAQLTANDVQLRGLHLTPEQRAVVQHVRVRHREPLVCSVQAFAGTAKTTTARAVVAGLRDLKFLYVVYNKAMQTEAVQSMGRDLEAGGPHNFEVYTTHSLAWRGLGVSQRFRGRKIFNLSLTDIRKFLTTHWQPNQRRDLKSTIVSAVRNTVNRFMTSSEDTLSDRHLFVAKLDKVVAALRQMMVKRGRPQQVATDAQVVELIVDAARRVWDELKEPTSSQLPLPHNAYLKLFALQRPRLGQYDVILIDEAQDINSVTKQIFVDLQEDKHVLLLGDKHQQIYSFNHACGLMSGRERLRNAARLGPELSLRQTFRFGPEIAMAVNAILKAAFDEQEFLIGREQLASDPRAIHPGVVYVCLPQDRDLTSVTAADLSVPSVSRLFRLEAAPSQPFRLLQCPLRGDKMDPEFPSELSLVAPNPAFGAVVVPEGGLLPAGEAGGAEQPRPRVTIVARRNSTLVVLAMRLVAAGKSVCASFQEAEDGGGGYGGGGYGGRGAAHIRLPPLLQRMKDVYDFRFCDRRDFRDPHVLCDVQDMEELAELVEAGADPELGSAVQLVDDLRAENPKADVHQIVNTLLTGLRPSWRDADYYLTTAHKMKGREGDVVQLAEDFVELSPTDQEGIEYLDRCRSSPGLIDELNAVYVAASRAKRVLLLNRDLSRLVLGLHHQHVQLKIPGQQPQQHAQPVPKQQQQQPPPASPPRSPAAAGPSGSHAAGGGGGPSTPVRQLRPAFAAASNGSPSALSSGVSVAAGAPPTTPPSTQPTAPGSGAEPLVVGAAGRRRPRSPGGSAVDPAATATAATATTDEPDDEVGIFKSPRRRLEDSPAGATGLGAAVAAAGDTALAAAAAAAGSQPQAAAAPRVAEGPACAVCQSKERRAPELGLPVGTSATAVAERVSAAQQRLPGVWWRGRPLCRHCAGATVFHQVLELAEQREARLGARQAEPEGQA